MASKVKACCAYVVCCGCLKCICRKREPTYNAPESRLKRFRRFMNFGNFKLGILKRALYRKQAEQRMNKLVEEEMMRMGKLNAVPEQPKEKPRGLRALLFGVKKQKAKMSRVSMADVTEVVAAEAPREAPPEDGEESVSSLESGAASPGGGGAVPPPHLRFRSHYQPRKAEADRVEVRLGPVLKITGACFVSSRGTEYDAVLHAWRFLTPGVSAVRFEFALARAAYAKLLEVRLTEFCSPHSARGVAGSAVKVGATRRFAP